ncbi:MAG: VOC family protein [Elusimicrobia bacterium]|nr:VOC family protein [Elusimicrobiota bacterium]
MTRPLRAFSPKKCGEGVIGKFLERFGEGIQQVEFLTKDVEAACEQLKTKGFKPIYEKPRPGADGALVNFVLVDLKNGRKILVEFVENKND